MGLCFIEASDGKTALYDSVTEWAFGPVFTSPENAERFCDWCETRGVRDGDLRSIPVAEVAELADTYFAAGGRR